MTLPLFALLLLMAPSGRGGATQQPSSSGASSYPADQESARKAAARALFQEGLAHADARRWSEAADRFERARALRPTAEIAYNLTTALVGLGKLVRATEVLREITAASDSSPGVIAAAQTRLAELTPRLAHLTVNISAGLSAEGASVWLNGQRVDDARLGVSLPADPVMHVVEVRHGGGPAPTVIDRREVALREGERRLVSLADLRVAPAAIVVERASAAREGPTSQAATTTAIGTAPADSMSTETSKKTRWWVWGLVGGAVALGVTAAVVTASMSGPDPAPSGNVGTWTLGK